MTEFKRFGILAGGFALFIGMSVATATTYPAAKVRFASQTTTTLIR